MCVPCLQSCTQFLMTKWQQWRKAQIWDRWLTCIGVAKLLLEVHVGLSWTKIERQILITLYRWNHFVKFSYPFKSKQHPTIWFLAATKQLYDLFCPSVRPSVCPSVTSFSPCSHHRIIMKFSGVITMVRSDVHAKGQGQRSRSQRSTPNLAVSRL